MLHLRNVRRTTSSSGFTLVEMIVAVGLFAVVMLISIGALMSLVTANRKAQALQSVINNLNITVDGMVRAIREGSEYVCGVGSAENPDCAGEPGGTSVAFRASNSDQVEYRFESNRIEKRVNSGAFAPLTAPEVKIDSVSFYVIGAIPATINNVQTGDFQQPKVMIIIKGTAGNLRESSRSSFHVQATAVQRVLDI